MKKLEKMSLANTEGKLTRNEMKNIMAGSGWYTPCNNVPCFMDLQCQQCYDNYVRVGCSAGYCRVY